MSDLCKEWENAASPETSRVGPRTVITRIGVVLGLDGGALARMLPPFRLGLGGPLGSGRQWVSWIHIDDLTSLLLFLLEHPECSGTFNATAPTPVTMTEFASALGHALHRPSMLPVPGFALRAALGEVADVLLTGQKVLPERAIAAGFQFQFSDIASALLDLVRRRRAFADRSVSLSA